jgi:hypothetical protein
MSLPSHQFSFGFLGFISRWCAQALPAAFFFRPFFCLKPVKTVVFQAKMKKNENAVHCLNVGNIIF